MVRGQMHEQEPGLSGSKLLLIRNIFFIIVFISNNAAYLILIIILILICLTIPFSTPMTKQLHSLPFKTKQAGSLTTAIIAALLCAHTSLKAQNPEPNSVGIYYSQLYDDTVKQKCEFCLTVSMNLEKINGLRVLERGNADRISAEINLSNSGLVSEETRVKQGNMMLSERFLTLTGINFYEQNGFSKDVITNYSFTDFKTGKITYSKNRILLGTSLMADLTKVASRTYTPPPASPAKQERSIRSVSVDLPVNYDFRFKGVFPEEGEAPIVRESDNYFVLKDGQTTDPKKSTLAFSALYGAEGAYSQNSFEILFKPSLSDNEQISMDGTFSPDRSKIITAGIYHYYSYNTGDDPGYMRRESSADYVRVENLVYNKSNMGGTFEFVPGVSKIAEIKSQIDFYETGEMPLRTLTATHTFSNIDESKLDFLNNKVIPKIYMMTGSETKSPSKPFKKIYLRGNWTGYAFITEELLREFPTAEIFDQTENFTQKVRYEKSLNLQPGQQPTMPATDNPAQPQAGEAIIRFHAQPSGNGGKSVTAEIQTSSRTSNLSLTQPSVFKGYPATSKDPEAEKSEIVNQLFQQADFMYNRTQSLAKLVVKELNR